jgi:hypothetical protein
MNGFIGGSSNSMSTSVRDGVRRVVSKESAFGRDFKHDRGHARVRLRVEPWRSERGGQGAPLAAEAMARQKDKGAAKSLD